MLRTSQQAAVHQDQRQRLRQVTEKIIGLPSLPTITSQLITMLGDPTSSARQVSQLVSADQALIAKILKVANSAFYGFPRQIKTVQHAIVVLGFEMVKNLGLSVAVLKRFGTGNEHPLFDRERFWEHAIGCGVACRLLARKRNRRIEAEAFIAGVLHDIGKLILIEYFPDEFGDALERAHDRLLTIAEAEREVIGVTHADIGGWLAEKWNLPQSLVQAIAHHHDPAAVEEPEDTLFITHMGDVLTRHHRVGNAGDALGATLSPVVSRFFKGGRDISDERLLEELSAGFDDELERAQIFRDLGTDTPDAEGAEPQS